MKLVTFDDGTGPRVGVLDAAGAVVDVSGAPGVGIGFDPPVYLEPGDVVEVSIDGVGTLTNPVA